MGIESQYADEPLNDLQDGEINAGPAVGMEKRLERAIISLFRALASKPDEHRTKTVLEHNQRLLNETGPKRTLENRHQKKGKSKVKK